VSLRQSDNRGKGADSKFLPTGREGRGTASYFFLGLEVSAPQKTNSNWEEGSSLKGAIPMESEKRYLLEEKRKGRMETTQSFTKESRKANSGGGR